MADVVFLTGFPGFIAERLVARLAENSTRFYLLVLPELAGDAADAVARISRTHDLPIENFTIVEGDITKPELGLSSEDLAKVVAETTSVFHLAAVYDLAVDKDLAFAVNLEGTKNVNELVKQLPGLRRYNYISTCYVAGKREGRILETELDHDAGFRNAYEETKYLAELEVEQLKGNVPVTIFRPSVVVGDSNTGETVKYDGIYALIQYLMIAPRLLRFVNVGNSDVKLNLVPVDFVVESIAVLSQDARAVGKTIALADPDPMTTSELFDTIAMVMTGRNSLVAPPAKLVEASLMLPITPVVTGLPHTGVPYFFLAQSYDTSAASEMLASHDITCPRFDSYVEQLISFVKRHPEL